jgi:hypothetical protein
MDFNDIQAITTLYIEYKYNLINVFTYEYSIKAKEDI